VDNKEAITSWAVGNKIDNLIWASHRCHVKYKFNSDGMFEALFFPKKSFHDLILTERLKNY
jgi:hypothetical protein